MPPLPFKINKPPFRGKPVRPSLVLTCLGSLLLLAALAACLGKINTSTPAPVATSEIAVTPTPSATLTNEQRLARPIVSSEQNPTQLDQGNLIYWGICMACHGDRGQGLTDEWRAVYGEDQNCWTSKCHTHNHPPQGFLIPRDRLPPPIKGMGTLTRFNTAQGLYDYILISMPWWNPNSLTPEKAWAVTAAILNMNGVLPRGIVLGPTNAAAVAVHHAVAAKPYDLPWELFLAAVLGLIAFIMVLKTTGKFREPVRQSSAIAARDQAISGRRRPNFLLHLHPPTIPASQARWSYTLGTGGLAVFLSLVLLVTGILEMYYYIPLPDRATISVQTIATFVPFGGLVRNLHFWGAQLLVLVLLVHLLRVLLTGAYKQPRRFNYLLGLVLLVLTLSLDFTGYILRWDEGVSWALVVGTNLIKTIPWVGTSLFEFVIGSVDIGPATLLRFYSWHIFGLTLAMMIAVGWHLFRMRRDGGIAAPPAALRQDSTRITRWELLRRELLLMTFAGMALVLLATFAPAPVTPPLNSLNTEVADARAPWFFLWIQQLLKVADPFLMGVVIPLALLAILVLLPYLKPQPSDSEMGRWFPRGGRMVQVIIFVLSALIIGLTVWAIIPAP